jgi:hypothetical protein
MFGRSRRVDNHDRLGFIGRGLDETTVGQRRHDLCLDLLVAYWRVGRIPLEDEERDVSGRRSLACRPGGG